jgi:hypothetical protein
VSLLGSYSWYMLYSLDDQCWLVVGCGSPEGLGVEVVFLHCALTGGWLSGCGLEGLGGWHPKIDCAIACGHHKNLDWKLNLP